MKKLVALLMLSAFMLFVGGTSYALSQPKDAGPKVEQFHKMDVVVLDYNYTVEVAVLPKPMSEVPVVIGKATNRPAEAKANSPPGTNERSTTKINPNARARKL